MLVSFTLGMMLMITLLSLMFGSNFVSQTIQAGIDNEAFIDGGSTTFEVVSQNILFSIDLTSLVGALGVLIIVIVALAFIFGIQFLGSGFNPEASRLLILASVYSGVWALLSVLAYPLYISIELFGLTIYIVLTIGYVVGVIQSLSGGK